VSWEPGRKGQRDRRPDGRVWMKEGRMIRRCSFLLGLMLAAALLPAHAQGGCVDSPEDPTVVLALLGGLGAVAAGMWTYRNRKH
jgi:XrtJ-associated TM-motif-TM protein